MIGLIDYGAGNLRSVANALNRLGKSYQTVLSSDDLEGVDKVILPGVGQFSAAANCLSL